MNRKTLRAWTACLLLAASGCAAIQDHCIEAEMGLRNHVLAQKAWGEWSWCYHDLDHPLHFARGFKDGYRDILDGGSGCQPTLPPKCYWKPHFQNADGRAKTDAWFDGFSHGALAAQQDGFGNLKQIPISPTARANMMTRHARPPQSVYGNAQMAPLPDGVPAAAGMAAGAAAPATLDQNPGPDRAEGLLPVPVKPYEE